MRNLRTLRLTKTRTKLTEETIGVSTADDEYQQKYLMVDQSINYTCIQVVESKEALYSIS